MQTKGPEMSHPTESMNLLASSYTQLVPCVLNQVVSKLS